MASTVTYTQESINDLDVITIYKDLMKVSTGPDSGYIRAKETLQAILDGGQLKGSEEANMVAQTISGIASSITSSALQAAIEIAKENRNGKYVLTKMREDTLLTQQQREKLAEDTANATKEGALVDQKVKESIIDGWVKQAAMEKDSGVTLDNLPLIDTTTNMTSTMITDKGMKWEQEQQIKMSVYATLAKSFRESGTVTWTVDPGTNKITTITDLAPTAPGLTRQQELVAIRQRQAFDDNKVQHAANSSANMIGLLLSASDSGAITTADVTKWRLAVDELNSVTPAAEGGNG